MEEFAKQGVLAAVVVGLAYFIARMMFPVLSGQLQWAREQIEETRKENREQMVQFMAALERRDQEFAKVIVALDRVADKIDRLGGTHS